MYKHKSAFFSHSKGVYVSKKKIWEKKKKKKEKLTHPYLGEKMVWGLIPYVQSLLLSRYLREDLDEYPVFLWK